MVSYAEWRSVHTYKRIEAPSRSQFYPSFTQQSFQILFIDKFCFCENFCFSGTPVGLIFSSEYIPGVDVNPRKYEIGWHLDSCVWGKGYATEAAKALIDQIKETGLKQLYAVVDQANPKSLAVCERLGMTKVGLTEEWFGKPLIEYVIELNW